MPESTIEPTDIERRQFGALAADVAYLRRAHRLLVAPYCGNWRIGTDVLDEDGLRAYANRLRLRDSRGRSPTPVQIRSPVASVVMVPENGGASKQEGEPPRPVVVLERERLADRSYRRQALIDCAQACGAILRSFPAAERAGLIDVITERLAGKEASRGQ